MGPLVRSDKAISSLAWKCEWLVLFKKSILGKSDSSLG